MAITQKVVFLSLLICAAFSTILASADEGINSTLNESLNTSLNKTEADAIESSAAILFSTDFENYDVGTTPSDLTIYYGGKGNAFQVISTDEAHSGSKSFQVWGAPGWCANVHYYFSKPETGRIGFEVWMKTNPSEEGWIQFLNPEGAQWGWGWGGVGFDQDGNINAPATISPVGYKISHTEDRWYKVRSEMDVETGACWIWIDDELVLDGVTPAQAGKENPEAFQGIRALIFGDCSWYENPSTPTYFDDFRFYVVPSQTEVDMDIKPGSCPNPVNTKSRGVFPVAILGTERFNVSEIDPSTINLSREGIADSVSPVRFSYDDVAAPFEGEICDCNDLGGDGYMDLMLHFDTQAVIGSLKLRDLMGGTVPIKINGSLKEEYGGKPIKGTDCIKVLA